MCIVTLLYTTLGYALPHLILYLTNKDEAQLYSTLDSILVVDVLQFATLFFVFYLLCVKLKWNNTIMVCLAVVLQVIRSLFLTKLSITEDISLGVWMNRLFIGTSARSYFPFICWMIFPIIGKIFAEKMIAAENKRLFYKKTIFYGSLVCIVSIIISLYLGSEFGVPISFASSLEYAQMHLLGNVVFVSFALLWLSICYFMTPYISESLKKVFGFFSKNTTIIYCLHFPIIKYILLFVLKGNAQLGVLGTVLFTCVLLAVGSVCAIIFQRMKYSRL